MWVIKGWGMWVIKGVGDVADTGCRGCGWREEMGMYSTVPVRLANVTVVVRAARRGVS